MAGACAWGEPPAAPGGEARHAPFLEPGFPFIESTVDARRLGEGFPAQNLTPRGVVLALGDETYACFDTDLLRLSVAWHGGFLTPGSIAALSYQEPLRKMGGGEKDVARPVGEAIVATGLYPGWSTGVPDFADPRPRGPDPQELGRGPLEQPGFGWEAIEPAGSAALLRYRIAHRTVAERWHQQRHAGRPVIVRQLEIGAGDASLSLVAGEVRAASAELRGEAVVFRHSDGAATVVATSGSHGAPRPTVLEDRYAVVSVEGGGSVRDLHVISWRGPAGDVNALLEAHRGGRFAREWSAPAAAAHWPEQVVTRGQLGAGAGAHVVDAIALPSPNPWRRAVRPIDIDFFPDGRAVIVTFDGDVYVVSGLDQTLERVAWKRIASGFNEPQSVRVRGDEIFVFSRGGLARLVRDGPSGEASRYESFADDFTQSADTRDYALSLALTPDGSFLLAKGGQQIDHRSRSAGRVLEVSEDGRSVSVFATGLRNAYLAVHPETGLATASDQQGHWVPATPVHVLERGDYLGFEPSAPLGVEDPEPREPPLWLPHRIAQSGIDQVWVTDERLGPSLRGSLLYVDYHRPGLVKVLVGEHGAPQAAVQMATSFAVPLLKGEINPRDGQLYLVGFRVWDSEAELLAGMCRLRYTGSGTSRLPTAAALHREGVWLWFPFALDPARAADPGSYRARSWSYRRTGEYGSPYYRSDGEPGSDPLLVHTALPSPDGRGVFLALPGLALADQVEVSYALSSESGEAVAADAYFTAREIPPFRPGDHGFGPIDFPALFAESPSPRRPQPSAEAASRERGEQLFTTMGCASCHSVDGSSEGRTGPTLAGVSGSRRRLLGGGEVQATRDYLRAAILEPAAQVTEGFDPRDVGMPSYLGILSERDVTSLLLFIESLPAAAASETR